MKRVLVIEDEALVAAMIHEALSTSNYQVVATAMDVRSAEQYLDQESFDAVILDINLEGNFEGIEIGRKIRSEYRIPFIYLTAHADSQTINRAKITEPAGYLVKPFTEGELLAGLEIALYNFKRKVAPRNEFPSLDVINKNIVETMSEREYEVAQLVFKGKRNVEIAKALFVSINTIKSHLLRLYSKFGVRSRTEFLALIRNM